MSTVLIDASDLPAAELQAVVSCPAWALGTKLGPLQERLAPALHCLSNKF